MTVRNSAVRDAPAVLAPEECRGGRLRPDAKPVDRHHLAALGKADHDRRDAGDVDDVALQYPERDPGRDAGVDRIAARFEDEKTRMRRRVMPGRDHVTVARQHAAMSRNLRSLAFADHVNPPGSAKRRNVCAQPASDNTARRAQASVETVADALGDAGFGVRDLNAGNLIGEDRAEAGEAVGRRPARPIP